MEKGYIIDVTLLSKNNDATKCCLGYRTEDGCIEQAFDQLDVNESYHVAVSFIALDCVQFVE